MCIAMRCGGREWRCRLRVWIGGGGGGGGGRTLTWTALEGREFLVVTELFISYLWGRALFRSMNVLEIVPYWSAGVEEGNVRWALLLSLVIGSSSFICPPPLPKRDLLPPDESCNESGGGPQHWIVIFCMQQTCRPRASYIQCQYL